MYTFVHLQISGLVLAVAQVSQQQQFLVRASFLEIYNEEVRDLLSKNPKNKLDLKERKDQGIYVKGLNSFVVKSVAEITSVLEVSLNNTAPAYSINNQALWTPYKVAIDTTSATDSA